MIRQTRQVLGLVALPTIGLAVALAVAPGDATREIHIWLVLLLCLASLAGLRLVHTAYPATPSPFGASLRVQKVATERPPTLVRLEREVSMAGTAAFDVHFRLRPPLVELTEGLLAANRGIDLDREPDRARAVVGEDTWELVRPDRPQPTERHGPGIDPALLDRVVTALERV